MRAQREQERLGERDVDVSLVCGHQLVPAPVPGVGADGRIADLERRFIRRQLRVYTAQGRFTGYTLAVLPIIVGFVIFLVVIFTHVLDPLFHLVSIPLMAFIYGR